MSKKFGVDLSALEEEKKPKMIVPKTVKGRIVHIDADFLAYQVSADNKKSIQEMRHNCDARIEKLRLMAGAEHTTLHLTPNGSDKGGRHDAALLKEYQGNRKNKAKPKLLNAMRTWMHQERGAVLHPNVEADDGMAMEQYRMISEGRHNLTVIASKDKDLTMVPGLQLDWDTGEISDTNGSPFGHLTIDSYGAQKKLRGRGTIFFWAQMLMGDTADHISGLPKVYDPQFLNGKPKQCGPMMAHEILSTVKNDKEAFALVKKLYKLCGEHQGYVNYRTGEPITYGEAFLSEARLLWMRRKESMDDVVDWITETCK